MPEIDGDQQVLGSSKLEKHPTSCTSCLLCCSGQLLVYSRPEYPVVVKKANIKAGKCLVHIIDTVRQLHRLLMECFTG